MPIPVKTCPGFEMDYDDYEAGWEAKWELCDEHVSNKLLYNVF